MREEARDVRLPVDEVSADWPDLPISVQPPRPRIEPGRYVARSVRCEPFHLSRWGRRLIVLFDVYAATRLEDLPAPTLARLEAYFRLPAQGQPLRATSKLARVFDLLGAEDPRRERKRQRPHVPMTALRDRLWLVVVRDVEVGAEKDVTTGAQRALHTRQRYSVIGQIVEHLA